MTNRVTYEGTIEFELPNVTRKHEKQSEWKRTAMILFDGDLCEYYCWFLKKRFDLQLQKPLRNSHISFINDNFLRDSTLPEDIKEIRWEEVKNKYNNKKINVTLSLDYYTNTKNWWLMIPHDCRRGLHDIRKELGLSKPYAGLHMSIGLVNDKNMTHSEYIHRLHNLGLIELHENYRK